MIYHLETYDITTIRAGTPMFLLSRKVKAMGIKMVMSGEGADETLAGYLYFHKVKRKGETTGAKRKEGEAPFGLFVTRHCPDAQPKAHGFTTARPSGAPAERALMQKSSTFCPFP